MILIGKNDQRHLIKGWYGIERSPEGIYYRASKPRALFVPCREGVTHVTLLLSARPEHTGMPLEVSLHSGESGRGSFTLCCNGWTTRTAEIFIQPNVPVVIEIKNPWSPDSLYHNGDIRALGILLSAIRFSPPYKMYTKNV